MEDRTFFDVRLAAIDSLYTRIRWYKQHGIGNAIEQRGYNEACGLIGRLISRWQDLSIVALKCR
jgi:hypothetical protein